MVERIVEQQVHSLSAITTVPVVMVADKYMRCGLAADIIYSCKINITNIEIIINSTDCQPDVFILVDGILYPLTFYIIGNKIFTPPKRLVIVSSFLQLTDVL